MEELKNMGPIPTTTKLCPEAIKAGEEWRARQDRQRKKSMRAVKTVPSAEEGFVMSAPLAKKVLEHGAPYYPTPPGSTLNTPWYDRQPVTVDTTDDDTSSEENEEPQDDNDPTYGSSGGGQRQRGSTGAKRQASDAGPQTRAKRARQ